MASCPRCHADIDAGARRDSAGPVAGARPMTLGVPVPTWCKDCEQLYDGWVRRYATDIVWQALVGTIVVSAVGLGLPILGVSTLVAAAGAFAGFGTIIGLSRVTRRRRRHQFLQAPLPRAYLPAPK
jgi:hypothetical protein